MPVIVETPSTISDQDRNDLARIYADAPDWLFAPLPGLSTWSHPRWQKAA